jgi:hypothetical protein
LIGEEVIFTSVSFGLSEPEVGPAGEIPGTEALTQLKVVPDVALDGL